MSSFIGLYKFPELKRAPQCMIKLYEKSQNHPKADDYLGPDVKLLSNDGVEFYCHRIILAAESDTLTTLFSRSADEGNEANIFSKMHSTSLKLLLQFIYTGVVEFYDLEPETLLDLLDAGELYDLAILKEACVSVMETKMLENPKFAPIVINTYNFQYSKIRAIGVLVDNYHNLEFEDGFIGLSKSFNPKLFAEILDFSIARSKERI